MPDSWCRSYSTQSNRVSYLLVPNSNPHSKSIEKHGSSKLNPRVNSSWRPINSSRLSLANQFANNTHPTSLSPASLSQDDRLARGSDVGTYHDAAGKTILKDLIGPPKPPGPEDCCMSGCAVCVYDIYAQESEAYLESLKQRNHLSLHEGPSKLQAVDSTLSEQIDDQVIVNNSLKVFAQFEKNRHR
ncbi:hypothetical protein PCANC_03253 [Puccinia coronata f. sp. avenae]|uniref:Oxidoreductase-like domain-containing protein n=1 Tax=Puccinia coronata f. sp. avenae TaxID=200324 RepID=A0A2N5U2F4_9BASI|nr:hypothetical protein PCANC_02894 [Puccinia coronata f. sp. avenae]PLW31903.1 hypothetical protein PCASD_21249 [Puccinia coronata f. sp. avenae]PLW55174.1 hypothetical protein PCANC_03253 [Puccinia coronata f. sp. avenae]